MTKSTITRERIQRIIRAINSEAYDEEEIREWLSSDEIMELSRMALAAMDSEPVAEVVSIYDDPEAFGEREIRPLVGIQQMPYGTKLYRHAQPAPVVPEEKPIPNTLSMYAVDAVAAIAEVKGWNACRAAMLQAGNHPAQSDFCPAQNHVSPEQNGDTPAQSQGWIQVSEQMPPSRHEVLVGRWWGEKPRWCCKWATYIPGHPDAQSSGWLIPGASWTPTHWMQLPAGPQEVKGE
ncbi:DUF551 domain-containing protein [Klebsiella pneumoniae]|uniref:DUF551 domain-containing protein n=1 Tax=Klebsiella pneumoniae TaxID=573 RepID=UPI002DBF04DD|nr:DUF551 domain-containing protein [Klebsiella pneumoniae]MEB6168524.1 DUF551 domain-containing protein [Klebsiella pneumoniae]